MSNLLGYTISDLSIEELLDYILLRKDKINIVSGNPQVLYNGMRDNRLFKSFNDENSIIIPDGIGVVMPLKLKGKSINKIAGIDLFIELIKNLSLSNKSVYFLGSEDEVLCKMMKVFKKQNNQINIVGFNNGFISCNSCNDLLDDIKEKKPYALFVGMGSPKQELFIEKYMNELPCNIFMGVGGSFDVVSSTKKRAPKWIIKMNLEWLYRIIKEPLRINKFGKNIIFLVLAFIELFKEKVSKMTLSKKHIKGDKENVEC